MKRRAALVGGVAAVVGGGLALWRAGPPTPTASSSNAALWALQFQQPAGGTLTLSAFRGRPLLLNFWATWCPPCIAELPLLDQFHREQSARGWQVVGLAVDNLAPVVGFLAKRPVGFGVGLAGLDGIELARSLGNRSGALPFTAVFDRAGALVQRKLGVIEAADLRAWVQSMASGGQSADVSRYR